MPNHVAEDSVMKEVSVAVDGEEARISFVDHMHGEMSVIVYFVIWSFTISKSGLQICTF